MRVKVAAADGSAYSNPQDSLLEEGNFRAHTRVRPYGWKGRVYVWEK